MAKDFRTDRIRTRAIIGTGSILSTKPHLGLIFYSASKASDYSGANTVSFTDVGDDVWLYFDGIPTTSGEIRPDGSSVLFGGDVVVSGTLWGNRSVVEVSDSVRGDFYAPNRAVLGGSDFGDSNSTTMLLVDPFTTTGGSNGNGTVSFGIIDGRDYPATQNTDVFFHVSGSRGVKDSNDRGLALFDGDVFISGNLELSPESSFVLAGDLTVATLTLTSNALKNSESEDTLLLTNDQDIQSVAGVKVGNDALTGSDDTVFIFHSGSGDVGVEGTLQVSGREIKDARGDAVLRFAENVPNLFGTLVVTGSGSSGTDMSMIEIRGDNNPANLRLQNNTSDTSAGTYLGGTQYFSNDGGGINYPGAYIYAKATNDWDVGSGGSVADTGIEFWTRGTSDASPVKRLTIENNPNRMNRAQLVVSGNIKLARGTSPGGGNFAPQFLSHDDVQVLQVSDNGDLLLYQNVMMNGDVEMFSDLTVLGDLDVQGTLTTIDTTNLRVSDALIEVASAGGGGSNNTNGGIAIASGSSLADTSLVFGRGSVNNTWRAGRKDTQGGTVTDVSDSVLVDIQAAGLRFGSGLQITGSFGGGGINHLTASSAAGGILLSTHPDHGVALDSELQFPDAVLITAGGNDFIRREAGNSTRISTPNGLLRLWNLDRDSSDPSTYNSTINVGGSGVTIGNRALGSNLFDGFKLTMSSSGDVEIFSAAPGAFSTSLGSMKVVLSASSIEPDGGPVIILSSSQEYNGGLGNGFEGFITIGATQDQVDRDFTTSRHRDVRTFLSGAAGTAGSNTRGVTLVGGDLVVSGNTDFKGAVAIGSIATENITLTSVGLDEPHLRFRNSDVQINRRTSDDAMVFIDGDLGVSKTLRDLASLSVVDNTRVFAISGGEPSYIKTTGSFSFDTDNQYTTAVNGGNSDTYFYVSGSIGSADYTTRPGNGDRGTAVFGGDIHVSGSVYTDQPLFYTTLHTAYSTPDDASLKQFGDLSPGSGAVIDTNNSGIPLQLRNPGAGVNDSSAALLSLTGSLGFEYSGAGSNTRLHMQSNNDFEFHNSSGEVFRMVAGDGLITGVKNLRVVGNNQLQFEGGNQYLYGLTQDTFEKVKIHANGTDVTVNSIGRMEVTGSLYPGVDNTYDLGSNDYRWANIYTGDLHLQNERGDWTVIEEEDFLTLRNNKNGKRYKLLMELIDEE